MPCAISCTTMSSSIGDDDAVLVIDETVFLKTGQSVMRSGGAIHWFGREDHELPDRRLRCLRFASWPYVHRSRVVSSKEWTDDPDRSGSRICACRCRLCDQTKACDENDRTRDSASCTIQVGLPVIPSTVWQHRTATTSGQARLRAWGQQRSCVSILGKRPPVAGTGCRPRRTRRSSDWKRLSAGAGTKGPRCTDWCYLELADLERAVQQCK